MKNYLILFVLTLCIGSCKSDALYEKYVNIPNYIWNADHKIQFQAKLAEKVTDANVELTIRYDHLCPHSVLDLSIVQTSPAGISKTIPLQVRLKDKADKNIGEPFANLWDLVVPLTTNVTLDAGKHAYVIEQKSAEQVIAVVDVGLRIVDNNKTK